MNYGLSSVDIFHSHAVHQLKLSNLSSAHSAHCASSGAYHQPRSGVRSPRSPSLPLRHVQKLPHRTGETPVSDLRASVLDVSSINSTPSTPPWGERVADVLGRGSKILGSTGRLGHCCRIKDFRRIRKGVAFLAIGKRSDWLDACQSSSYGVSHSTRLGGLNSGGCGS